MIELIKASISLGLAAYVIVATISTYIKNIQLKMENEALRNHVDKLARTATNNGEQINNWAAAIHILNRRWWYDISGKKLERNIGEMLMLTVSELAEAMEGHRKDLMDDHLPHYKMFDVELADTLIRLLDLSGVMVPNIGEIVEAKLIYNQHREDHTYEARAKAGGKKY